MLTIKTTAAVAEDGNLTVRLPPGVRPGIHRIVLIVRDAERSPASPGGDQDGIEVGDIIGTDDTQAAAFEAVYARGAASASSRG